MRVELVPYHTANPFYFNRINLVSENQAVRFEILDKIMCIFPSLLTISLGFSHVNLSMFLSIFSSFDTVTLIPGDHSDRSINRRKCKRKKRYIKINIRTKTESFADVCCQHLPFLDIQQNEALPFDAAKADTRKINFLVFSCFIVCYAYITENHGSGTTTCFVDVLC